MTKRFLGAGGAVFGGVLTIGSLVTLWYDIPAGSVVLGADQPVAQRAGDLDAPVPVTAGGEPIDVEGYAAPFVGDFDGDGRNDLLVGQYVYGKLRVYRNAGTNAEPKFDRFEWFTVDGLPACVPSGCYVADFNGDGRQDLLVGDNFVTAKEVPEPPAKQGRKDPETTKAWNDHWSEVTRLSGTRSHVENVQEQNEGWRKLVVKWQQLAANDPDGTQATSSNVRRHGRVWLYQRH
jgi:hypothetical protein